MGLAAGIAAALAAVLPALPALGAAPLCDKSNYYVNTCEPCELNPDLECNWYTFYYCATGEMAQRRSGPACDHSFFEYPNDNQATACPNGVGDGSETPANGIDDNANGCIDEGTTKGDPPCECQRECKSLVCGALADCNPSDGKKEQCGDREDNNCNGQKDEGCYLPLGP